MSASKSKKATEATTDTGLGAAIPEGAPAPEISETLGAAAPGDAPIPDAAQPTPELSAAAAPEGNTSAENEGASAAPAAEEGTIPDAALDVRTAGRPSSITDVRALIAASGLPAWKGAALCRAEGWAPGKQVTEQEFAAAVERLAVRRMGG